MIQVPSSLKKIKNEVKAVVEAQYPNVSCIEDVSAEIQNSWEKTCDHEMFYQDINRYIGDIYHEISMKRDSL